MPNNAIAASDLPASPEELRSIARDIAIDAARMVAKAREEGFGVETKSSDTDMVTDVDKASDNLISKRLTAERPDDALLTEESGTTAGTSGIIWVVDPIDGTTNFVYGHPPYAVSIAAVVDGTPVASAVCDISSSECFSAGYGIGADLNGKPLGLRPAPTSLETALVATGFGYSSEMRRQQGQVVGNIVHRVRDIRRGGSAATDICWVAAGRSDAYFEAGLEDWDLYGGQLIATEAGAAFSTFDQANSPHSIVFSHPAIHSQLIELLLELDAEKI